MVHMRGDQCGDVRIEPDTRHVEKQPLAKLSGIHLPDLCADRALDRLGGVEGNAQAHARGRCRIRRE